MSKIKRSTQINQNGYREVIPSYRLFRANQLDKKQVGDKGGRLVCPMIDAARSRNAYGHPFLQGLKSSDLEKLANVLGVSSFLLKTVAYFSGKFYSIPKNIITGSFDENAIKNGIVHSFKNGVHTAIFKENHFNQNGLNNFVWSFHPQLKDIAMTNEWLYTSEADELYFDMSHLPKVLEYNKSNRPSKKIGLGLKLSTFEMNDLLLNVLGQKITTPSNTTQAILIRDIHDLYKYGFVPASVEEKLAAAELIDFSGV